MGPHGKAYAALGLLMMRIPQDIETLLVYWVQSWPWFAGWPDMLQRAVIEIVAYTPPAALVALVVWYVENHKPSSFFDRVMQATEEKP